MAIDFKASGQEPALEFIDKDMLVSASAGSGKTTVMVEKILRYLKTGDITKIIVLTFTKASAADMREKLTERLSDAVRLGGEHASNYREQLKLLPFAYIGTIDSICGQIFKRYFEVIAQTPALDMLDEEESKAFRNLAMDQVFVELIKSGDATFNDVAETYGNAKGLEGLKEGINGLLSFLSAQEDPDKFIEFAREEMQKDFLECKSVNNLISYFRKSCGLIRIELKEKFAELLNILDMTATERTQYYEKLVELDEYCSQVTHSNNESFVKFINSVEGFANMPRRVAKSTLTFHNLITELIPFNDKIKEIHAKAKDAFGKSVEELRREDEYSKSLALKLLDVVTLVRERFALIKKEEGKQDFEDVERFALAIFNNDQIAKEFSESIDYIFLDEYQDTNKLQEAIFKRIARNNLFMVGDVKQAIYGFREAEPLIFLEKFYNYQKGEEGKNVSLKMNFRSAQEVLSFVDDVFSVVMTYDFGGIDYDVASRFGKAGLSGDALQTEPNVEVAVFTPKKKDKDEQDDFVYSVKEGRKKVKEDKEQDWYIINKIQELVGKVDIFDKEINGLRKIRYSDIALLYRKKEGFTGVRKLMDRLGIPYNADGFEDKGASDVVDAINNYLRVIDNYKQDKYLAGAMLSRFGKFTESELAEIRKQNSKQYYFHKAVKEYDGPLKEKVGAFFSELREYKKLSSLISLPALIGKLMTKSGYLSSLLAEGNGNKIGYYNAFIQQLRSKRTCATLEGYMEFLDSGMQMEIEAPPVALNAVAVMTVHKSKGLEFPVVILGSAGQGQGGTLEMRKLVLDSRYGVATNSYSQEDGSSTKPARRKAIERAMREKENFEALRLMYVALTRAKCRLYVVGETALEENAIKLKGKGGLTLPSDLTSFIDWIIFSAERKEEVLHLVKRNPVVEKAKKEEGGKQEKGDKEVAQLTFMRYPYEESTRLSNKYTVTGLNVNYVDEKSHIPSLVSQNAETGVAYHKVMELIDFNLTKKSEVEVFVKELEEQGLIEKGVVDAGVIQKTLTHPLFDEVRLGKCLREQEFIYYAPACEVLEGASASDKTLVQGVMDLIVEGEQNLLIDYKVSGAPVEVLRERYRVQIALYARAYEEMTGKKLSRKAVFVLNRGEVIEF